MSQCSIINTVCYCNSEQIVEEAGGVVTCMDGGKFCVFDRSVLVSNGVLHDKVSLSAVVSTIQEKRILVCGLWKCKSVILS